MTSELEHIIGYSFNDPELLTEALTHSSYCNEHALKKKNCNERLEFLGDAVLELASSRYLFELYPDEQEGQLSKLRAASVCESALAVCARELGLGKLLRMGKGELRSGGNDRDSILSDALEAVLGALYLDAGFETAEAFIRTRIMCHISSRQLEDFKTALQEKVQAKGWTAPDYILAGESGPEHDKQFTVEVRLNGELCGTGFGHSKKSAEQAAAEQALKALML